ncbi:MAG: DUF2029 domain-containing protein [Deltaproteobacteria bacterium]|nr:DUF2029 domain-containing protein [Deltaproteobacteria bacterium]
MPIPESITTLYAVDWRILMTAATQWWHGGNPYGYLSPEFGRPGAFAYPPTALSWLWLFLHFGGAGFIIWTTLQLGGWWLLIRRHFRSQLMLLSWSPLFFHLLIGQTTLSIVLVLWAATESTRRGFWWGVAVAWAMTKPQAALLPLVWLLWQDRAVPHRHLFWLGIVVGTSALALPPTLMNPGIWVDWIHSLSDYRTRTMQMVPWQGFGIPILIAACLLWFHRNRGNQKAGGWQWWLSAALFPQTALYSTVVLLPLLRPKLNYWTIAGLALSSLLIGPATDITLPIILSGHILAAWFICGGPRADNQERVTS